MPISPWYQTETTLMSLSAFVLLSIVLFYTVNVAKSLGSANVQCETLQYSVPLLLLYASNSLCRWIGMFPKAS